MEIFGYILALVIGITLGLIGGGGSILSVPVLAYFFQFDEKFSTAYSLFIVGISALVGGLIQNRRKLVDWRIATLFGLPAILGVWIIRYFVVPILPESFFTIDSYVFTRKMAMFGLFILLMVVAAVKMLSSETRERTEQKSNSNYSLIFTEGLVVGAVTGLVGAGGGFLIIPALVFLSNISLKKAIGTSLIIIAMKSLLGFLLGDAITMDIDWLFLASFSAITIVGIFVGTYLSAFVDGSTLKKGFGYFLLLIAVLMFGKEFII